jgi:hypothetical protein
MSHVGNWGKKITGKEQGRQKCKGMRQEQILYSKKKKKKPSKAGVK